MSDAYVAYEVSRHGDGRNYFVPREDYCDMKNYMDLYPSESYRDLTFWLGRDSDTIVELVEDEPKSEPNLTFLQKIAILTRLNVHLFPRDPTINAYHAGAYMIIDDFYYDDGNYGFAIVGDDPEELVEEGFRYLYFALDDLTLLEELIAEMEKANYISSEEKAFQAAIGRRLD